MSHPAWWKRATPALVLSISFAILVLAVGQSPRSPAVFQQNSSWIYPAVSSPTPSATRTSPVMALPAPSPAPAPTAIPRIVHRVGIQVGHSLIDDVPNELSQLRGDWGVTAGGWDEIAINRQIVNSLATVLTRSGIVVDVLPSTVPEGYKADLFLSVHANAHKNSAVRGFMVARSAWTEYPKRDDALVQTLLSRYGAATGMPDIQVMVTDNMTEYYAFNYKAYRHAISPETPAAIIEMGFMSNSDDLDVLTQHQTEVSWGIASAVMEFLSRQDR